MNENTLTYFVNIIHQNLAKNVKYNNYDIFQEYMLI